MVTGGPKSIGGNILVKWLMGLMLGLEAAYYAAVVVITRDTGYSQCTEYVHI